MPTNRSVLVTGCSCGIGEATAARLAREGWTVYATARRPETLTGLGAEGCRTLALDVTDEESMRTAVARAEEEQGGALGALVNNAGYSQSGALEEIELESVRRQFETNVFGLLRMSQLVLPAMRDRGEGRIVNVGSMGGKLTFPGGGVYHATKHAVEALSDALRFEVEGFGVDVVLIEPGLIKTDFAGTAAATVPEGDGPYAKFNRRVASLTREAYEGPMSKLGGGPDAVAKVIAKSLSADRPRTRYTVTISAPLTIAQRRILPDRVWDRIMRTQFPSPGRP